MHRCSLQPALLLRYLPIDVSMDALYESAGQPASHPSSINPALSLRCPIALLAQLALLAPPDQSQLTGDKPCIQATAVHLVPFPPSHNAGIQVAPIGRHPAF